MQWKERGRRWVHYMTTKRFIHSTLISWVPQSAKHYANRTGDITERKNPHNAVLLRLQPGGGWQQVGARATSLVRDSQK